MFGCAEYMRGYRNKLTFANLDKELAKRGIERIEGNTKVGVSSTTAYKRPIVEKKEDPEETPEEKATRYAQEIKDYEAKIKALQEKLALINQAQE